MSSKDNGERLSEAWAMRVAENPAQPAAIVERALSTLLRSRPDGNRRIPGVPATGRADRQPEKIRNTTAVRLTEEA